MYISSHTHTSKKTAGKKASELGFPGGSDVKASAWNEGDPVQPLGWEDPLEKEMATHSSTLAWRIPWMEEPGRLPSMGSQSQTRLSDFTSLHFCEA